MMRLTFIGAPGAGKGTQAAFIAKRLNIPTISTGNILREAIKAETEVGLEAKLYVESGKLVPDEIIIGILDERLKKPDCANGFILDGVPRTLAQAVSIEADGIVLDSVISLEIADEVIEERMTGRRVCKNCGASFHIKDNPSSKGDICDVCDGELVLRADDAPETVKNRLVVFHNTTEPLKNFYAERGLLRTVRADLPINEVTAAIEKALGV